ncbi:autoinducer binding domain-containing protein [Rhodovulum sp. YNF3179]|uniref:autoinducer binding domain-containing protein n=1 Tax=Rhodovulum sp. YNF3179 TaxID=3425127 RepID=UPI003D34539A
MDLIDLSMARGSNEDYTRFLDQVCERFELDYAAYAGQSGIGDAVHGYVNYPDEWKLHYARKGFHRIDPTLHEAGRSIAPVDWQRLERNERFQSVFRNAREFGISDRGLTIPVRGPYGDIGMFSVTRDCKVDEWARLKKRFLSELQSVAVHIHDNVMQSDSLVQLLRYPALSTRELEILQWIAAGKSQQDVGDILSISHRTVEVHLRSSREKLCALTTSQAIGRAIGLGLIFPA